MSLNWTNVKSLAIPVGGVSRDVKRVTIGGAVVWEKPSLLPYDAEVEYLESTGTQWIDTGYAPKANSGVRVSFRVANVGSNDGIFGARTSGGNDRFWIVPSSVAMNFGFGGAFSLSAISANTDYMASLNFMADGKATCGANSTNISGFSGCPYPLYIFAANVSSAASFMEYSKRIYGLTITEGNEVVHDYIPVRKSGVGYLYDRITGTFPAHYGTFQYGGDLNAHLYDDAASILMWDGIENTGYGVHDATAAAWQDLIRADKSITVNGQTWGSNCLDFYNSPMLYSADWTPAFKAADPLTIEAVISTDAVSNTTSHSLAAVAIGGAPAYLVRIFYVSSAGSDRLDVYWGNVRLWTGLATLPVGPTTVTITRGDYDGTKFTYNLYVNGVLFATTNVAYSALVAGLSLSGYYRATNVWPSNTHLRIHAVRMCSRALTAAEVARRAMIDKRRFMLGG